MLLILSCFRANIQKKRPVQRTGPECYWALKMWSEGQDDIQHLLTITWLLHICELSTPAVGDASLGDLGVGDGVAGGDILRPHDTGYHQFSNFKINSDFLVPPDDQISVRQDLGDNSGNRHGDTFRALNLANARAFAG